MNAGLQWLVGTVVLAFAGIILFAALLRMTEPGDFE